MSALFWLGVRWIATALIGVAVGSAAVILGFGSVALLIGAIALLLGGLFVGASVSAHNTSLLSRGGSAEGADADLVGPGLLRATFLGWLGAGLIVGALTGNEATAVVAASTAVIALALESWCGASGGATPLVRSPHAWRARPAVEIHAVSGGEQPSTPVRG